MENLKTTWDFVEKYFPNYSSSDEILRNNDLSKAIEEGEEGLQEQMNDSNAYVFEKAIEGYLRTLNADENENIKLPIYWSTLDFEVKAESNFKDLKEDNPEEVANLENWEQLYDKSKFAHELEIMISGHDATIGITWLTVEEYLGNCEIRQTKN